MTVLLSRRWHLGLLEVGSDDWTVVLSGQHGRQLVLDIGFVGVRAEAFPLDHVVDDCRGEDPELWRSR